MSNDQPKLNATPISPIKFVSIDNAPLPTQPANSGLSRRLIITLGGIMIATFGAIYAMYYYSTSVIVNIQTIPENATIAIDGDQVNAAGFRIQVGSYPLLITHAGFVPYQNLLVVERGSTTFTFQLNKTDGQIHVSSDPAGIEVLANNVSLGSTPLDVALPPGEQKFTIASNDYYMPPQLLQVEGSGIKQALLLNVESAESTLSVSSNPTGAQVLINGEGNGTTPLQVLLSAGIHELEVKYDKFKDWTEQVKIVPGAEDLVIETTLVPQQARYKIETTPSGAATTISGKYSGRTPLTAHLNLTETHEILFTKENYLTRKMLLTPKSGEHTFATTLEPQKATLKLSVSPGDSTLYIDGREVEITETLTLIAGRHAVEASREGFELHKETIVVRPNVAGQLKIKLLTAKQAIAGKYPLEISTAAQQTMRYVTPMEFKMGAPRSEPGRRSNEVQRSISLTRPFYVATHEIKNSEFQDFQPGHASGTLGRILLDRPERPVVNITWIEAVEYCNWLSEKEGLEPAYQDIGGTWQLSQPIGTGYRLPSEAEWSRVSRFGTFPSRRFPWGNVMPPSPGSDNIADESLQGESRFIAGYKDGFRGPAPGGLFRENSLGIYDLGGNVSEWIHDVYTASPSRDAEEDPFGPTDGVHHVIKGASYISHQSARLRWSFRDFDQIARPDVGFRIARYAE